MTSGLIPPGKKKLPHTSRTLSARDPHHVVLTIRRGLPALHSPTLRELILTWLSRTSRRYGVLFSQATVMADHIHLVMQSPGDSRSVSRSLQFFASKLALSLNKLLGRRGPVFNDRFFSRVIRTASDLLQTVQYVARNPVKAGYVIRPEDWEASSVRDYLTRRIRDTLWKYTGPLFGALGFFKNPREAMVAILMGLKKPRRPGASGRQLKLPFARGLARPNSVSELSR